ncbi:hypothetical protein LOTGIDRAFT_204649 [Lottia gigantea]|uniref:Thioredoxin domain-containing protein n=1 Tax=Lottia gigantea TaxID=225164 RepID=V3ZVV8_LOTGI|nr:hypothetical protein LOTGIDRAFT_204649 [Lottia gigantea]ESO85081.1 hypothetical protein LOTGIDRAFT_204649 [Lottia gigantea]
MKRVLIILLAILFKCIIKCQSEGSTTGRDLDDVSNDNWKSVADQNDHILIIFCKDVDDKCKNTVIFFNNYPSPPGFNADLKILQSTDLVLANELGASDFPKVVYYRQQSPAHYDGDLNDEDFSHWLLQAQEISVKILTDDTFEHLTQAVTGSTTGDWLVLFYKDDCPVCKQSLIDFETVAVKLKGKTNVAQVDMNVNPKLVDRFKLTKCPSIIFFKQGTMYRYEMEKVSVKILMSFVQAWYRNMKAEKIPFEPTAFDKVTDSIVLYLKKQLNGPYGKILLGVYGGSIVLLVLLICSCCLRKSPNKEKAQ